MPAIETEVKKLRAEMLQGFQEMRKLICGKNIVGNWVSQDMSCAMLDVGKRRMSQIRKHIDSNGQPIGFIRWRKSSGKKIEYWKPDLEKWLSNIQVQ